MNKEELTTTILNNLLNADESYEKWDSLQPTDADYMMYSPLAVGYNTTAEQRFLMQNLLIGYAGGSILDIGCGRCDLYGVAKEMAALNNDIILYDSIDHNPVMTALGEQKWGLEGVRVGDLVTVQLNSRCNESKTQPGRYFNSITCWKLTAGQGAPASAAPKADDDLPF